MSGRRGERASLQCVALPGRSDLRASRTGGARDRAGARRLLRAVFHLAPIRHPAAPHVGAVSGEGRAVQPGVAHPSGTPDGRHRQPDDRGRGRGDAKPARGDRAARSAATRGLGSEAGGSGDGAGGEGHQAPPRRATMRFTSSGGPATATHSRSGIGRADPPASVSARVPSLTVHLTPLTRRAPSPPSTRRSPRGR